MLRFLNETEELAAQILNRAFIENLSVLELDHGHVVVDHVATDSLGVSHLGSSSSRDLATLHRGSGILITVAYSTGCRPRRQSPVQTSRFETWAGQNHHGPHRNHRKPQPSGWRERHFTAHRRRSCRPARERIRRVGHRLLDLCHPVADNTANVFVKAVGFNSPELNAHR